MPYDLAIPLLGIYLKKTKTLTTKDICTLMFIAALFMITKTWNQPKYPSVGEWIKKIHTHTHTHTEDKEDTHTHTHTHTHRGILLSCKKERTFAICCNMDGPGGYCCCCC